MSSRVRILSVGDDDGLRFSRQLLLSNDGYETESVTSGMPLSASIVRTFDIAIICRSVERERALALAELLRQWNPEIRILMMSQQEELQHESVTGMEIAPGPEALLEACRKLSEEIAARHGCCEQ